IYILMLVSSALDCTLLYGGSAITVLIILLPVIEKLEILPFNPFFCSAGAIIVNWFPETDHVPVDVLPGPSVTTYVWSGLNSNSYISPDGIGCSTGLPAFKNSLTDITFHLPVIDCASHFVKLANPIVMGKITSKAFNAKALTIDDLDFISFILLV